MCVCVFVCAFYVFLYIRSAQFHVGLQAFDITVPPPSPHDWHHCYISLPPLGSVYRVHTVVIAILRLMSTKQNVKRTRNCDELQFHTVLPKHRQRPNAQTMADPEGAGAAAPH